jgi:hypothetical protein
MNSLPLDLISIALSNLSYPDDIRSCTLVCKKWIQAIINSQKLSALRYHYPLFFSYLDDESLKRFDNSNNNNHSRSSIILKIQAQEETIAKKFSHELHSFASDPEKVHTAPI